MTSANGVQPMFVHHALSRFKTKNPLLGGHLNMSRIYIVMLIVTQLLVSPTAANARNAACDDPPHHQLDFWVGEWEVFDGENNRVGTSVLAKAMNGCAIDVHWLDPDGSKVWEIFYYEIASKTWKQVWIGDNGATKERVRVDQLKDGSVRFLGEVRHRDGTSHQDRSTVTPVAGGNVHQVIETSSDGGRTWAVSFDAEYRRRK